MEDLAADFIIQNNSPIEFDAEISESEHFDCSFEIFASGTTWGSISGTLSHQTDLQQALDLKADKTDVESVTGALADSIQAVDNKYDSITSGLDDSITAIDNKYDSITGALDDKFDSITGGLSDSISAIDSTIGGYGDIVTYNAADFATSIQGGKADTALQPNDNISELNNDVGYITSASLPTVNDSTITIQKNGTDVDSFTLNQSSNDTINITVPTDTSDLTNGAGFLVNNATGTKALAVGNTSQSTAEGGVAVGYGARANSTYATAIGEEARANNTNTTVIGKAAKATEARAIAIGSGAEANAQDAIAIKGINNTANTFQVYTYNLLDMSNGLIPDARISSNIARTADIPSLTNYVTTNTAQTISQTKAFSQPLVIADNNGLASGTLLSSKKILQRSSGDNTLTLNNKDNKLRLVGSETRPQYSADGTNYSELALYSDVTAIDDLIPSAATISNQLADKDFVNSSIATNTANFIGTFNSVADLEAYSGTLTNNDYAFVVGTDAEGNTVYDRYKYTDATTPPSWIFEYELNNSSFTAAQWDAINSGITSGDVALIATALQSGDNVSELVNDAGYITGITSGDVTGALGYTPYSDANPSGYITSSALSGYATETWVGNQGYALASNLATVATSGDYTDLLNTPTIPIVDQTYDGTSANAQSGVAIAGAGFITSAALSSYVDLSSSQNITGTKTFIGQKKILFKQSSSSDKLGFTLYNSSNTELGALEYRPNTISGAALLNLNCPYTADYVGFRYWGTAVNIIAPKVATSGDYYIPINITDGNTTVTAANTGTVNISSLLPDISGKQNTLTAGSNITISGDTISATDTTYSIFTGADSVTAGASGLVPAPSAGDEDKILTGGGSWESVTTALGYTPVNKAGDTMTGDLTINDGAGYMTGLKLKSTDLDITTTPNENKYSPYVNFLDENGVFCGAVYFRKDTNGNNRLVLGVTNASAASAALVLQINDNGNTYTSCPSPSASSDTNSIATTEWVNDGLYYRAGDTVTSLSNYIVAGYLTSSKTRLRFSIPLPKRMNKINTVTINTLVINARQGQAGYLPSATWNAKTGSTVSASFTDNMLQIECYSTTAFTSFTNNVIVNVEFDSFKCTFS